MADYVFTTNFKQIVNETFLLFLTWPNMNVLSQNINVYMLFDGCIYGVIIILFHFDDIL